MTQLIDSPFSDCKAELQHKQSTIVFREKTHEICEYYYVCQNTKIEFTTSEIDKINLDQIYSKSH